jgi:hypothetical protein
MHRLRLGDCREEALIDTLFGSVPEFARLIEEFGDNFTTNTVSVEYDEATDIHTFYHKEL